MLLVLMSRPSREEIIQLNGQYILERGTEAGASGEGEKGKQGRGLIKPGKEQSAGAQRQTGTNS